MEFGLAQREKELSALQKKPWRSLLPPPNFHSFRSSLPTCHLHCDKLMFKWFQWGFFNSENRRNWVIWGEKQSRIWFSREGKGEKFCFWRLVKCETRGRKEVGDFFFVEEFFLREISAIGAIAEDFWCFNPPSSYPEQVAKLGVTPIFWWLDFCNVWCPHCDDVCVIGLSAENVWLRGKVLRSVV